MKGGSSAQRFDWRIRDDRSNGRHDWSHTCRCQRRTKPTELPARQLLRVLRAKPDRYATPQGWEQLDWDGHRRSLRVQQRHLLARRGPHILDVLRPPHRNLRFGAVPALQPWTRHLQVELPLVKDADIGHVERGVLAPQQLRHRSAIPSVVQPLPQDEGTGFWPRSMERPQTTRDLTGARFRLGLALDRRQAGQHPAKDGGNQLGSSKEAEKRRRPTLSVRRGRSKRQRRRSFSRTPGDPLRGEVGERTPKCGDQGQLPGGTAG